MTGEVPCLFCRVLINPDGVGIGNYYGHAAHKSCSDWIVEAKVRYEPIKVLDHPDYDPDHKPIIYGFASACLQDLDYEWPTLADSIKEKLYTKYLDALTKHLDYQEKGIRTYCERHGLPEPKIVKELKQNTQSMIEVYKLLCESKLKPGDHLILAVLPRTQRHNRWYSASLVIGLAERLAKMGVTFHSAFVGLDWSKPVTQQACRLALNIQTWQQSIFKDAMVHEGGRIQRMFGYSWRQIQNHQTFQWVIRHIRDKKMSPAEVWDAGTKYYSVHCFLYANNRWWCQLITKNKNLAWEYRKKSLYYCKTHKKITENNFCHFCGEPGQFVKPLIYRGTWLNPRRRNHEGHSTFMRMWAFYTERHPEQEKQPWLTRSRFPEILRLQDVKLEDTEVGEDKE